MPTTSFATQARQAKADHAAEIGIDEALISDLVASFYARVRDDPLLGLIFAARVEDWPAHLSRMTDFWASIAIEGGRFRGNPMIKHIAIGSLERHHFDRWLELFSATLDELAMRDEARAFFRERASRIADSLLTGIEIDRHGLKTADRQPSGENASC